MTMRNLIRPCATDMPSSFSFFNGIYNEYWESYLLPENFNDPVEIQPMTDIDDFIDNLLYETIG